MVSIKSVGTAYNMQIKKAESKKKKRGLLASSAAATGSNAVQLGVSLPLAGFVIKSMSSINKKLSKDQINQIMDSADKFINSKGLSNKGVAIHNIESAGVNLTGIPNKIMEYIDPITSAAAGKNAFFTNKAISEYGKNSIILNKNKMSTAVFHEIGHAINSNNSKFWRLMQGMRTPTMALAAGLALFGAFTNKAEAKDGKELTTGQKAKNAIRNNAGKLAFAAMIPMLAEEGMASIRGCKWAKSNLPKELFKKVLKTNICGYASYLGGAVALGLAALTAVKIKDHFTSKYNLTDKFERGNIGII